jgi:acetylornithine deacetylase/succinyl-diaminopimelate desuccinylase-like protein
MSAGETRMAAVTHSENVPMKAMLCDLRGRQGAIVKLLGEFVRCESPSHVKRAVDECAAIVAREWQRRGAKVRILRQRERGNHMRAEIWDGAGRASGQIMMLGHMDTVYPLGTLALGGRELLI